MNLNEYFDLYGHQQAGVVAKKAGTTLGYLRGCLYGQRRMSADIAIRLEDASNGEMTARELRSDLPWPAPQRPAQPATGQSAQTESKNRRGFQELGPRVG